MEAMNTPTSLPQEYRGQDMANPQGHRYTSENAYIENDAHVSSVLEEAYTTFLQIPKHSLSTSP